VIALKERQKLDTFPKWIAERATFLIKCLGRCRKPSKVHAQVVIYDSSNLNATFWISSVIASMTPIASIAVVTHVESQTVKLGVIAAFNALKTLYLNVFKEATPRIASRLQQRMRHASKEYGIC
jgi:hypothetical protein